MGSIILKEIRSYINSLTGYLVIGVFLIASGLFFWIFPDTSVLDYGFADMGTFFSLAPYLFMFLIPAVTMKSIAEEKKSGMLDILLTKPVTEFQLIFGKFLASLSLVLIALIPTIIYYISIYFLGTPVGNIDTASVLGSYIGLFLLASSFVAIGIFGSSITDNQIVAFVVSILICYLIYAGFDLISSLEYFQSQSLLISQFGVSAHYESLSKGLIDSRDILYFISISSLMLLSTKFVLGSRKW